MFKRATGYSYQQIDLKWIKVQATQTASEKVTNTVGTFLNKGSDGSQIIKVKTKLVVPRKGLHYLNHRSKKSPPNKYSLKKYL